MRRIIMLLQKAWWFFVHLLGPTDQELWEQILEDADREYQRGNTNFFAIALVSDAYEEWVHDWIIMMLFLSEIPKPAWLKFEHVINHDTSDDVLEFAVHTFTGLQMIWKDPLALELENMQKFKVFYLERSKK